MSFGSFRSFCAFELFEIFFFSIHIISVNLPFVSATAITKSQITPNIIHSTTLQNQTDCWRAVIVVMTIDLDVFFSVTHGWRIWRVGKKWEKGLGAAQAQSKHHKTLNHR